MELAKGQVDMTLVPVFRAKSIDEFEMDLSGCGRLLKRDHGGIEPFAGYLRRRVREGGA